MAEMTLNANCSEIVANKKKAQQLLQQIEEYIAQKNYGGVLFMFSTIENLQLLQHIGVQLLQDIIKPNLIVQHLNENAALYDCAEQLLHILAKHAPANEMLLEVMEMLEEQQSEQLFTCSLRALQTLLLRISDTNARALDWALNSVKLALTNVHFRINEKEAFDLKAMQLQEQREDVQLYLTHLITVGLFNEALIKSLVTSEQTANSSVFRNCGYTRSNILCCFLITLLDKPLALLDLTCSDERKTNSYTLQCARNFCQDAISCIKQPFLLFSLAEQRLRFKRRLNAAQGVYELSNENIFLIEETLPIVGLAIFYYLLYAERIVNWQMPQILSHLYVFETGLYFVLVLLQQQSQAALQHRALLLLQTLLKNLPSAQLNANHLQHYLYTKISDELSNLIGYSAHLTLRRLSVNVLADFINKFSHEGRYLLTKHLLNTSQHLGLKSHLFVVYKKNFEDCLSKGFAAKDMSILNANDTQFYLGEKLDNFVLEHLCYLPKGVETDLVEYSIYITTSLNTLRYFTLAHCELTGFYKLLHKIEENYLKTLRKALDLSKAHYKEQLKCLEDGKYDMEADRRALNLLQTNILNESDEGQQQQLEQPSTTHLTAQRISMLRESNLQLDMISFVMSNLISDMEYQYRKLKLQQQQQTLNDTGDQLPS